MLVILRMVMEKELSSEEITDCRPRLDRRQYACLVVYVLGLVIGVIFIHEAAHIAMALVQGVPFAELKIGFWGINPSVTLPSGLEESVKTPIFYAGGLTTGALLLLVYFLYWVRKYSITPSRLTWALGLATIALAAVEFANGFLEGRYHAAYLYGATTLLSPTHMLTIGWVLATVVMHLGLCPRKKLVPHAQP